MSRATRLPCWRPACRVERVGAECGKGFVVGEYTERRAAKVVDLVDRAVAEW
jgi:hypothetical protein